MGTYPRTLFRLFGRAPVILGLAAALTAVARAAPEDKSAPPSKAPLTVEQPAGQIPDAYKLNMMIRTTLIALNQANQTGNYSVLRDLGTPQFQSLNSDARLGEIFAALRNRKLDLSPLLFFDPKLIRQPALQSGLLRLTGYIPTDPERILFDMGFERVGDQWRLSAIVIDVQPLPSATDEKAAQSKPAPKDKAEKQKSTPAKSGAAAPAAKP